MTKNEGISVELQYKYTPQNDVSVKRRIEYTTVVPLDYDIII